ncbi:UNVERIFIED_CONTAM: Berberine bridge enzyme-like 22 [Sesamum latifolium]|uniref:Berberine bridge enzyme-like 22 n=1 Tax=Sesamum latifolium TaxID=2727402 RepID=A0AAW2WRZ9_9LAMI
MAGFSIEIQSEDLFWAIRGGGGSSFGVILAWKVQLVDVPEKVTVFTIHRDLEKNVTQLIHRWQTVAPNFDEDLFIRVIAARNTTWEGMMTIRATFNSVFLGGIDRLLAVMQEKFPELGLVREDYIEMSWIQSILYNTGLPIDSLEPLLDMYQHDVGYFKGKLDYVQEPIPIEGAGYVYKIHHMVFWEAKDADNSNKYISWIRTLYYYVIPYVSEFPRRAFLCYRDLDIGVNNNVRAYKY